ncbi:hypothetical protein [uncultured Roseibium sp.]|uniref:hypothetical protein n=1 Tax=uncultured Roseibium sp. TaxID=1936171 RepID=UPI003217AA52
MTLGKEASIDIQSVSERAATIANALANATGTTHFVPAEGGYLELSEIDLPNTALVYRVDNGRIMSELADYADRHGMSLGDLKNRHETPDVQAVLHGLLLGKAQDPSGPIYDELEKHRRQTEPLLIQSDGTVLNGNRRLATMRTLLAQDAKRYAGFETVRAAVLPAGLGKNELEFIEAALQMAPDLKLDYSWINRRLKLRQHVEDMDTKSIVAAYRFKDAGAIDEELAELALVEDYLRWIQKPRHYSLVESHEEAFFLLRGHLQGQKNKVLADLWRIVGFAMILCEDVLDKPIAHYYPFTDPVPSLLPQWVMRTFAEDRGLTDHQQPGENRPVDKALAGRLRPLIDDYRHAESTTCAVVAMSDMLKGDEGRLIGSTRVLQHLRKARRILDDLPVADLAPGQLRQIRSEAAALEAALRDISEGYRPRKRPLRRAWAALKNFLP